MLEPGPETDLKVAEACGIEATIDFGKCCKLPMITMLMYPPTFQPSTDLNDAFMAAEKVGLFNDRCTDEENTRVMMRYDRLWTIGLLEYELAGDLSGPQATPALAICAAILKLKEKP